MYPKLIYLLTCIALLATSCNSDTSDDVSLPKGPELSFNIYPLSRGSVATSISQFLVYGDMKPMTDANSTPTVLFNKTLVEYIGDRWCYDGTQYWFPGQEHSFVALCPVGIFGTANEPQYQNSKLSFEYSISAPGGILSSTGDLADILVATHRRVYLESGSGSAVDNQITFRFAHLLSLVNFAPAFYDELANTDSYIQIHQLELSGVKASAQFNILPASRNHNSQTDDMVVDINSTGETNLALELSSPVKIDNTATNVSLFADNDAIIMLPQDLADESEAKLILSYTINGDTSMNRVSLSLKNLKWESGKSYVYKFTVTRNGAKFDNCEINPWNVIQGEEITVD